VVGLLVAASQEEVGAGEIEDQIGQEIVALEALARDELPKGVTVQSLFEVDLSNEGDVRQRIASLQRSIAASEVDLASLVALDGGTGRGPSADARGDRGAPASGRPSARA
jgi:hypothetical protein